MCKIKESGACGEVTGVGGAGGEIITGAAGAGGGTIGSGGRRGRGRLAIRDSGDEESVGERDEGNHIWCSRLYIGFLSLLFPSLPLCLYVLDRTGSTQFMPLMHHHYRKPPHATTTPVQGVLMLAVMAARTTPPSPRHHTQPTSPYLAILGSVDSCRQV